MTPGKPYKFIVFIFLLMLGTLTVKAQYQYEFVNFKDFKIDGQGLIFKKQTLLTKYGKPIKEFEPKYECGFHSEAEQGEKFYLLQYPHFEFIGNAKEGYILDEVRFVPGLKLKISYKGKELSSKTTIKEFEAIFGVKIKRSEDMFYFKGGDDALRFSFIKGKLAKIAYWSPC